ncbi:hypothetical protein D3C81_1586630 [compost metagenome]
MAVAEQEHGFRFQVIGTDTGTIGPGVMFGYRNHKGFIVDRLHQQALIRERQRNDGGIQFTLAQ